MIVVLDTNVIQADFPMKGFGFVVFLDYLDKTDSRVLMPRVVLEELRANYGRQVREHLRTLASRTATLNRILRRPELPVPALEIEEEESSYTSYALARLRTAATDVVEYKDSYLTDVMQRAIHRRRPCSERREEARDVVLWCTVKDIAQANPSDTVVFISGNTKDFAGADGNLHADLAAEVSREAIDITYFGSLDDFNRQHAAKIKFITTDWLQQHIELDSVLETSRDWIEEGAREKVRLPDTKDQLVLESAKMIQGDLDVREHTVYELQDQSFAVNAVLDGEVEVEYALMRLVERKEEYWQERAAERGYEDDRDHFLEVLHQYSYGYPEVQIGLDITVSKERQISWDIDFCYVNGHGISQLRDV